MKTILSKKQNFIFMMALFFICSKAQSQLLSQGPNNPAFITEQFATCLSCPGSTWMSPMNAMLPDNVFAQTQMGGYSFCFMTTCYYARALEPQTFGFNIPLTATITGIKAEVLRKASANLCVSDTIVQLLKNGNATGTNKASVSYWNTTAAYEIYGDSTDLWGATWTPAEINATNFGLFYKPRNKNPNLLTTYIDHVRITVYYTATTAVQEQYSKTAKMIYDNAEASLIISGIVVKVSAPVLKIYNDAGKLVSEKHFEKKEKNEKINLARMSKGIYIAKLFDGEKTITLKFLISSD